MLQLKNENLSPPTLAFLNDKQQDIDARISFPQKSARAGVLWDRKIKSRAGVTAFKEVKEKLALMSVGVELCNYCEQSEASDIEHILPKSLFPNQTFIWDNYLLACKKCNTTHKLDAMYVFNPAGSINAEWVTRGMQPPTTDYSFIHPRLEDPMEFMKLDFEDFNFYAKLPHRPGTRGFEKVERTLEILELNNRPTLVRYREQAFDNYKRMLSEYVNVKDANDHTTLENAVQGSPEINFRKPFGEEQQRVLTGLHRSILKHGHPTVWREMIRQRDQLPAPIQNLFNKAPEALNW